MLLDRASSPILFDIPHEKYTKLYAKENSDLQAKVYER